MIEKDNPTNNNSKGTVMAIFISDTIDFKIKKKLLVNKRAFHNDKNKSIMNI